MRVFGTLVVLFAFAAVARAERVPLSAEELKAEATHVVTGTVKAIYSQEAESDLYGKGTLVTRYLLEIEVDGVEKGTGVEKGELVYARCWRLKKHGEHGRVPGPSGHFGIPAQGEKVRAYVARGKYSATAQDDRGTAVVYPNGIESLKAK